MRVIFSIFILGCSVFGFSSSDRVYSKFLLVFVSDGCYFVVWEVVGKVFFVLRGFFGSGVGWSRITVERFL